MTISFKSHNLSVSSIELNLKNKGFSDESPTTGCAYVVQVSKDYQELVQNLQNVLRSVNLPIAEVRIPHATIIAAKVIDRKPQDEWADLEDVQRVYQTFFLYQVQQVMKASDIGYRQAVLHALKSNEKVLAEIATKTSQKEALLAIKDETVRNQVKTTQGSVNYRGIKAMALSQINNTAFQLNIDSVELKDNGSIIFQLTEDDRLLDMRLDLIIAGQGIAKWPVLSSIKNAWSTVAYTTKVVDMNEKSRLDSTIKKWVEDNQTKLKAALVDFSLQRLGSLAFRSNDFFSVKKVSFPIAKPLDSSLLTPSSLILTEEDLRMTPKAGRKGIEPIAGKRTVPNFNPEDWDRPIDQEVFGT